MHCIQCTRYVGVILPGTLGKDEPGPLPLSSPPSAEMYFLLFCHATFSAWKTLLNGSTVAAAAAAAAVTEASLEKLKRVSRVPRMSAGWVGRCCCLGQESTCGGIPDVLPPPLTVHTVFREEQLRA